MEKGTQLLEDVKLGNAMDTCSKVLEEVEIKDGTATDTCSRTLEDCIKVGSAAMTCSNILEAKTGIASDTCSKAFEGSAEGTASLDQYVNVWSN